MSETQTETPVDDDVAASIPNYSASGPTRQRIGGIDYNVWTVRFGEPVRTLEMRELDEADQWDLSEIAGSNSENIPWLSRALAAAAVMSIDGAPLPALFGVNHTVKNAVAINMRNALRKLGRDGVLAVLRTANRGASGVDPADVAKN